MSSKIKFKKPSNDSGGLLRMLLSKILNESGKINEVDSMLHEASYRGPDSKTTKSRTKIISNWTTKISASRVTFRTISDFLDEVCQALSIEFTIKVKWNKDYETVHTMHGKFERNDTGRKETRDEGTKDEK